MENNDLIHKTPESRIIGLPCTYVVGVPVVKEKTLAEKAMDNVFARQDRVVNLAGQQARTLDKKQKFLEAYADQAHGIITIACNMAGIKSRKTVYNWINSDPDFKQAMGEMGSIKRDFVEDLLTALMAKGNGPCIRFFLDRRHPDYMRSRLWRNYEREKKKWYRYHVVPPGYEEKRKSV